jgi:hypothetical protein
VKPGGNGPAGITVVPEIPPTCGYLRVSVRWGLVVKAVEAHTDAVWVILYVKRWLQAPLQLPDGSLQKRDRGTPQGSAVTPPTQWVTPA